MTIGNFDGFHRGHQYIVSEVNRIARERNGASAVMSLWPHPRAFFHPEETVELLTAPDYKKTLLEEAGLNAYFVLPFTQGIADMDRDQFLREIVLDHCNARCLVVGHDFSFGAGARGDFDYLASVSPQLGLDVVQLPALEEGDHGRISSTMVREHVRAGEMEKVRELLGRPYLLQGEVRKGRGLGRKLGYPTANIAPPANMLPAFGIYAARVAWRGQNAIGAVNIGMAPTVAHSGPMIEVHLLDVDQDLVGEALQVYLYHRLRGEKKFPDLESLKAAIEKDIVDIRAYFAATDT